MSKSILDAVKKEVDSTIWCDSITWRGSFVSFSSTLTEGGISPREKGDEWTSQLDAMQVPNLKDKTVFNMVQYGWSSMKAGGSRVSATFELKFR